jgi:hypothetical protein
MPSGSTSSDPDDGVWVAADAERLADDLRRTREFTHPIAVRNHRHPRRVLAVVVGEYGAAGGRADAEQREVIAGDDFPDCHPRSGVEVERGEHRAVAGDVLEHVVLRFHIEIVEIRRRAERRRPRRGEHVDEAVGRCHRERLEQHRVDDGEERGVEADADGERRDRDEREAWTSQQPPQREADVPQNGFEQDRRLYVRQRSCSGRPARPFCRRTAHRVPSGHVRLTYM